MWLFTLPMCSYSNFVHCCAHETIVDTEEAIYKYNKKHS